MMINTENSCAFAGHRPDHFQFGYDENHPDCIALKQVLRKAVLSLIGKGITTYYSGMALGVDTWSAELILELKVQYPELRLIAVLPCETQANKWTAEQRERYFDLLPKCDEVIYTGKRYTKTCIFECNRYMVDHAKYLLAVYNGQERGGTAYTVRYAKKKSRKVLIIYPGTEPIMCREKP